MKRSLYCVTAWVSCVILAACSASCTPAGTAPGDNANDNANQNDNDGGNQNANDNQDGGDASSDSGVFDAATGLTLAVENFGLDIPPEANPSQTAITMRILSEEELDELGLPLGNGFERGVSFEPSGTTFDSPVDVTVVLANLAVLDTLAVLRYDEQTGTWGDSGITALVQNNGATATFQLSSFSTYDPWNPPLPPGNVPIEDDEIIAGTGLYNGQPFSVFPNYMGTSASLAYSAFGDVFGLSLINVDLENPTTGDNITLTAGLHATEVRRLEEGVILGLVTPAGGLSGPSIYADGLLAVPKPVAGVMFLRKSSTQWMVDVYCHYEGGLVFGQAVGDLQ